MQPQNGTHVALPVPGRARGIGVSAGRNEHHAMDEHIPSIPPSRNPADDSVLWTALMRDSSCRVAVVDQSGAIEHSNEAFNEQLLVPEQGAPLALKDVYPSPLAEERLRILRRTLSTSASITLIGLVKGRLAHDSFRPLSARGEGIGRVLLVSADASPTESSQNVQGDGHELVRAVHDDLGPLEALTKREMEVLTHIGMGLSTADIAKALHRSVKTVEWHRVALGNKLAASNRVELARIAIRAGLCPLTNA